MIGGGLGSQGKVPKLSIVNLVVTADLNQRVDLARLTDEGGFRYDPSVYKCAYFRHRITRSKVSIFPTGKLISIGAKTLEGAGQALQEVMVRLVKLGLVRKTTITPKLQNVVATTKVDQEMNLEKLSKILPHVLYEPEQFPGAMYYPSELEGASVLIFANGNIVLAGLKRLELVEEGAKVVTRLVQMMLN